MLLLLYLLLLLLLLNDPNCFALGIQKSRLTSFVPTFCIESQSFVYLDLNRTLEFNIVAHIGKARLVEGRTLEVKDLDSNPAWNYAHFFFSLKFGTTTRL